LGTERQLPTAEDRLDPEKRRKGAQGLTVWPLTVRWNLSRFPDFFLTFRILSNLENPVRINLMGTKVRLLFCKHNRLTLELRFLILENEGVTRLVQENLFLFSWHWNFTCLKKR
jgi:hypothetical protein